MTQWKGDFFGIKYDMEFDTEKEFVDWMAEMMLRRSPLTVKILKILMEQA